MRSRKTSWCTACFSGSHPTLQPASGPAPSIPLKVFSVFFVGSVAPFLKSVPSTPPVRRTLQFNRITSSGRGPPDERDDARASAGTDAGRGRGRDALGAARVARLRGRPRQLPLRGSDADQQDERGPAAGCLELRARDDRFQPARGTRRRLWPRSRQLVRRAGCRHRQAAVGAPAGRRFQRARRELLGEPRRQDPPPDLQRQ